MLGEKGFAFFGGEEVEEVMWCLIVIRESKSADCYRFYDVLVFGNLN